MKPAKSWLAACIPMCTALSVQSATQVGNNLFLASGESLSIETAQLQPGTEIYGAEGSETVTADSSTSLILDGNIENLNLPLNYADYAIAINGTQLTFSVGGVEQIRFRGLNQPINVGFNDKNAVITLTGLGQIETALTDDTTFSLSGTVTGLSGGTITLANNETDTLDIGQNGPFTFTNGLNIGDVYDVSVNTQPTSQVCSVNNSEGVFTNGDISDVVVTCTESSVTVTLSGIVSAASNTDLDSDINDPQSTENVSNDTFDSAQNIANLITLSGFASAEGTGQALDRFGFSADASDIYAVSLQANQLVRMQVVDYAGTDTYQGDLDLYLYDSSQELIASSLSVNEFEEVTIPSSGNYFIQVSAFSGISKYTLKLDNSATAASPPDSTEQISGDFVANEAIVQLNTDSVATSGNLAQALHSQTLTVNQVQAQLSHNNPERAMLARWDGTQALSTLALSESAFSADLQRKNPEAYAKWQTLQHIKRLQQRSDVAFAHPNYLYQTKRVPNDTRYEFQWHYPIINLPQAWEITTGTPDAGNVIVSVIDTGVFLNHSDLQGQLVDGYDFISDPTNARDGDGIDNNADDPGDAAQLSSSSWHGTHVAGTVAAGTNNGIGVAGVSWGAKIMPLRTLGLYGGTDYDIIQAMLFSAGLSNDSGTVPPQRADIINMSLGGSGYSQSAQQAINAVRAAGVIIVAAAGNENTSQFSYPASYDGVISVSATDYNNNRAPYSNFGTRVDIAAPGGDTGADLNNDGYADGVLSTIVDDSTGTRQSTLSFYQGTSMATPHVAGVLALMKAVYPNLTPGQVDTLITNGDITNDQGASGRDDIYGHGIIDALKAVEAAQTLAQGGTTGPLPAVITASPSSLSLGIASSATLVLSNVGGESASILSVTDTASWLTVSAQSVDSNGLGTYLVSVDRTGLSESKYSATLTFSVSNNTTLNVQVSMQVGSTDTTGETGTLYLLLLDSELNAIDQMTPTDLGDGSFSYNFTNVSPGTYKIAGGSDIDNDNFVCQLGEICGGYPVFGKLSEITVTNQDISGLDFITEILSTFGATGQSHGEAKPVLLQRMDLQKNLK
ncbi:peptidase S8 and S53, subtilisin, kexin, sedolisin [Oleiphilus messinensis]|uniref:Peptidase S8 and S53, subtilisin, kexin, sedolisin n=1 Tax=Oleiphilus messinensis TaxID=141451 RepID=A0A1Y0I694_9GAMM|nr:S8 family serine peptidase [Oleiphilus messinensis]ARU55719.1 peptidase S8 and S53, subtilisin, kexin, sedolisin [Oleiphilus messinensis]